MSLEDGASVGGASAGAVKATIDFDADGLERAVTRAMQKATGIISNKVEAASEEIQGKMETGFRGMGSKIIGFLGVEDISSAINDVGRFVLNIGRETEQSLNMFQAVSGATKDQMKAVSDEAIALGDDLTLPGTSAADAAEAMTELAKAGFTVDQAMSAAKGTLELATAAQTSAGDAAETAAEQINAFNLKAEDAGHVADVLANAANESAADMGGVADSMKQVSAVSHAAGLSFEETAAAVALMANNSIQGSDAGTSLKSMLVALAAPSTKAQKLMDQYGISVYDSSGKLKDLSGIIDTLQVGLKGATDQQKQYALATIFGTDAIRAVNVLMHEGSDGMKEMTKNLGAAGAAQRLAAANSKGLTGSLNALQSTAESLAIEFYQKVSPALDEFLRGGLDKLPGFINEAEQYLGRLTSDLGPAADLVKQFVEAASPDAMEAFKFALAGLLGVFEAVNAVLGPIDDLIKDNETVFRDIVGPIVAATIAYKVLSIAVAQTTAAWESNAVVRARVGIMSLSSSLKSATTVTNGFRRVGSSLFSAMGGGWGIAIAGAATAVGIFAAQHAEAQAHVQELTDSLNDQTGALTKNTRELVANALEKSGAFDAARKLGIGLDLVTSAAIGNANAQEQVNAAIDASIQQSSKYAAVTSRAGASGSRMATEAVNLRAAINGENGAVNDAVSSHNDLREAMGRGSDESGHFSRQLTGVGAGLDRSEVSVNRFSRATRDSANTLGKQADEADRTKAAIRGLRDEVVKGLNAQIDFQESADNLRETIKKLTPEELKSGHALDIHYQAGRDVTRGMLDLVQAAGQVKGGLSSAREQIIQSYIAMGVSKSKAVELANQFFDLKTAVQQVPSFKGVKVDANTAQAISNVRTLRYEIDQLHDKTIMVRTTGGHVVQGHAAGGAVYGPGSGTSDSILRRLSNGEHVFTAEEVRDAGGQQNIYAIRAALRRGGIPALADMAGGHGALVDQLSIAVGTKEDLPDALDETLFHLRRIGRGGRYANN